MSFLLEKGSFHCYVRLPECKLVEGFKFLCGDFWTSIFFRCVKVSQDSDWLCSSEIAKSHNKSYWSKEHFIPSDELLGGGLPINSYNMQEWKYNKRWYNPLHKSINLVCCFSCFHCSLTTTQIQSASATGFDHVSFVHKSGLFGVAMHGMIPGRPAPKISKFCCSWDT